jgi:hypothetical protein
MTSPATVASTEKFPKSKCIKNYLGGGGTMYTYVSKYKNDKINGEKKKKSLK